MDCAWCNIDALKRFKIGLEPAAQFPYNSSDLTVCDSKPDCYEYDILT